MTAVSFWLGFAFIGLLAGLFARVYETRRRPGGDPWAPLVGLAGGLAGGGVAAALGLVDRAGLPAALGLALAGSVVFLAVWLALFGERWPRASEM